MSETPVEPDQTDEPDPVVEPAPEPTPEPETEPAAVEEGFDLSVFDGVTSPVTGAGEVTTEMRAVSWKAGYRVIRSDGSGGWYTTLR